MIISCDCSIEAADLPKLCKTKWVEARKNHQCGECREGIPPGKTYERVKGLWDDRWYTFKTCLGCVRIREHFCAHGWVYGDLAEQVSECIGYDYRE